MCFTGNKGAGETNMTTSVRLPENLEARLVYLAEKTGRSKSYYVTKAIQNFLEEQEDYLLAV
jgi:RHH-type rel operon transcriptional repressor/antitoxin RelB